MSSPFLTIEFPGFKPFELHPASSEQPGLVVPDWVRFSNMSCPADIEHDSSIDYCRLGMEVENLIERFAGVESAENGLLTMHHDEQVEIRIRSDAKTIFYNCLWFVLLHSNCSVFKYGQWARSNYMPSNHADRLFYMLFSIFLVEDFIDAPREAPSIEQFKNHMHKLSDVLNDLLTRIRGNSERNSASASKGIELFSNLVSLLDADFDEFYIHLRNTVHQPGATEKWV